MKKLTAKAQRGSYVLIAAIIASLCVLLGLFTGCSRSEFRKEANLQENRSISYYEENIPNYVQGIKWLYKQQNRLTDEATDPVTAELKAMAKSKRDSICSDQEYLAALRSFETVLHRRLKALGAEYKVYENWLLRDSAGLVSTNR